MALSIANQTDRQPPPDDIFAGDQVAIHAEVETQVVTLRAAVTRVGPGAVLLLPAEPDPVIERLERGQPLHLTIRRRRGALVAASTFLGYVDEGEHRLVAVERPVGAHAVQRREHLRLDIERSVRIDSINGEELAHSAVLRTINVSAGGVLVAADLPLSVGDKLVLGLELAPGDVVNAEGQVIRIGERGSAVPGAAPDLGPAPGPEGRYQVAIRFLDLRLGWEDRIFRHLFAVQRRQRDIARKEAALQAALRDG